MPPGVGYGSDAKTIKKRMRPGRTVTGSAAMLNRAFEAGKVKASRKRKK